MNKKKDFSVSIGFSSIMMVFIMICLVTFAALSVLTANSDHRLSKKMADKTTAYYQADTIAKGVACQIDQALASLYAECGDETAYYSSISPERLVMDMPNKVQNVSVDLEQEMPVVSYQVTISDIQTLYVTLEIHYPKSGEENFYEITGWQTKTDHTPVESDTHLKLFGG